MTLYVDPRIGSDDLVPLLTPFGLPVLRKQLSCGDVFFTGHGPDRSTVMVGVERKRLGDALQCMQDGRLTRKQIPGMLEEYNFSWLLIEDAIRPGDNGYLQVKKVKSYSSGKTYEFWVDAIFNKGRKLYYGDFMKWLFSIQMGSGLRLAITSDASETASWIIALYQYFQKPFEDHKTFRAFDESGTPPLVIPTTAMKVAKDLAVGIGWEKAISAAEHFRTAQAVVNATVEEWLEVDGIGKELAKRLVAGATEPHVTRTLKRRQR
jgi:ERCC4-type nuclease